MNNSKREKGKKIPPKSKWQFWKSVGRRRRPSSLWRPLYGFENVREISRFWKITSNNFQSSRPIMTLEGGISGQKEWFKKRSEKMYKLSWRKYVNGELSKACQIAAFPIYKWTKTMKFLRTKLVSSFKSRHSQSKTQARHKSSERIVLIGKTNIGFFLSQNLVL